MKKLAVLVVCIMTTACVIVPQETEDAITVNAESSVGDLNDWDNMSPLEQKYAFWQVSRFSARMNHSINDVKLPERFSTVPAEFASLVAPVASGQ